MATKIWVGTDTGNEGDYGTAANWDPAGVPGAGDDVYLTNSAQNIDDTLDQSAIVLGSFNQNQDYTGEIGTTSAYLQIAAAIVNIGFHAGAGTPSGSPNSKIDLGAGTAAMVTVHNTGSSNVDNRAALRFIAANAGTKFDIKKGSVSFAAEPDETSTIGEITPSFLNSKTGDAKVEIGAGVTLSTLRAAGGDTKCYSAVTTISAYAGTVTTEGSGAVTTINAGGGTVISNSSGTVTTVNGDAGLVDFTRSNTARTVTTVNANGAQIDYDPDILTITNAIGSNRPISIKPAA